MPVVPILLYHSVNEAPPAWIAPFTVKPAVFAHHLDLITALGCHALTVSEMVELVGSGRPWPGRPVVITIDDGFADTAVAAAPALLARALRATLYVTTAALVGGPTSPPHRLPAAAMLSWGQLPGLERDGIEIGAHTLTHPALDVLPQGLALKEIATSKVILEEALGHRVGSFAYPHGHYDRRVADLVRCVGFESACAVKNALSSGTDDLFALSRLTVMASTPVARLEHWLLGRGAPLGTPRVKLRTRAGRRYRRLVAGQWR